MKSIFSSIFLVFSFVASTQSALIKVSDNSMTNVSDEAVEKVLQALGLKVSYPMILDVYLSSEQYETINGIDTREVFNSNLNIQVVDLLTGKLLESNDYQLVGTAKNKRVVSRGLSQAIRKKKKLIQKDLKEIAKDNPALSCSDLGKQMDQLATLKKYQEALYLSQFAEPECQASTSAREKIYIAYQKANCHQHVINAKAYIAADNYDGAMKEIIRVDPHGLCNTELETVVEGLDQKLDADKSQLYNAYIESVSYTHLTLPTICSV